MAQKKKKTAEQPTTTPVSKKDSGNLVLNMTFHEAMKKALNTPLPSKKK